MNNRLYEFALKITCPIEKRYEVEERLKAVLKDFKHEIQLLSVGFDLSEDCDV
jgi:hypothetical protein